MKPELKSWCQQHHAECLAQLAVFAPARETLRADPSVIPALEAVAEGGLTAEARQFAEAALLALSEKELHIDAEGQKHVMLSCAFVCVVSCCCESALPHVLNAVESVPWRRCVCCLTLDDYVCIRTDQWDAQATVKRINESLIERGYVTWFDLTNMKGELAAFVALLCSAAADQPNAY